MTFLIKVLISRFITEIKEAAAFADKEEEKKKTTTIPHTGSSPSPRQIIEN